jgi:AcrR family transcriptional regulator
MPTRAEARKADPPSEVAPRRLNRESRRRQLVAAATALIARHGLAQLSLDEVAARAGITRNLIYHYFPQGRPDLAAAAVQAAEAQLLNDWLTQLERGLEPALDRILDHALAPTHAWRLHRLARHAPEAGLRAIAEDALDRALSELLPGRPWAQTALTATAWRGYLAFAETALDEARRRQLDRAELVRLLRQGFEAVGSAPWIT